MSDARRSSRTLLLCLLPLAAACASAPQFRDRSTRVGDGAAPPPSEGDPAQTASAPPEQAPAPAQPARAFDPKAHAASFGHPSLCEDEARRLAGKNRDLGWAVLRECVNRGFSNMKRLADGFWTEDLLARKDASVVLTKVIATRGGDIAGDLGALHQRRIALFGLSMAMEQPQTYAGKLVVARLRIGGSKNEVGQPTVQVAETTVSSVSTQVRSGATTLTSSSTAGNTATYGESANSARYSRDSMVQRHDNEITETGREGLLRLSQPDPFLAPGREFVVLARFQGVRSSGAVESEEEASSVALLSLVAYFEAAALVIE